MSTGTPDTADIVRRHVTLMIVPLAVIATGLVTQVLVPYGYPMKWIEATPPPVDGSPYTLVHLGAAVLAVSIALANRRGSPPGWLSVATVLLAILASTVMTAITAGLWVEEGGWAGAVAFATPIAITLVVTVRGLRARGWERMLLLLGAFSIAALPYACPRVPGIFNLFSAGLVFLAADLVILVVFARGRLATRATIPRARLHRTRS